MRVAAIQMESEPGALEANLAHAAALVEQAAARGARLAVLPELFSSGYEYTDRVRAWPELLDGPTARWIAATARRLNVHLVGSFPARIDGRAYIAAMLAAPDGRTWVYRKIHVAMWENCYFECGDEPVVAETDLGRVGLLICWDQAFADLARAYRGRVDLLCVPSSPPTMVGDVEDAEGRVLGHIGALKSAGKIIDPVTWYDRAQARYVELTGVPLVYAARCGTFHSPVPFGSQLLLTLSPRDALRVLRAAGTRFRVRCPMMGRSCILDAGGKRLAGAGRDGEALLVADVHPGRSHEVALPPAPRGRPIGAGIPAFQYLFDASLIVRGRRVRQTGLPGF